mgnify:CR=1 FL=1
MSASCCAICLCGPHLAPQLLHLLVVGLLCLLEVGLRLLVVRRVPCDFRVLRLYLQGVRTR